MNYPNLKIDEGKCIHCGLCTKDCILNCLELGGENNIPRFAQGKEWDCIKCQHCFAICPTGALSIGDANPNNSELIKTINSDELENLMKSRRSVRHYKPENLDKERLNKLKNILKWTPTGVNNHGLHFAFVDDIEAMDNIRTKVNNNVIKFLNNPIIKKLLPRHAQIADAIENGYDIIFRGAPHMVIVSVPKNAPCKREDPIISLSYFELLAQSMGVGTLWCGFAYYCFRLFPELSEYINIPKGHKIGYVMLFGKPDVKYNRQTQPAEVLIDSISNITEKTIPILKLIKRFISNNI